MSRHSSPPPPSDAWSPHTCSCPVPLGSPPCGRRSGPTIPWGCLAVLPESGTSAHACPPLWAQRCHGRCYGRSYVAQCHVLVFASSSGCSCTRCLLSLASCCVRQISAMQTLGHAGWPRCSSFFHLQRYYLFRTPEGLIFPLHPYSMHKSQNVTPSDVWCLMADVWCVLNT